MAKQKATAPFSIADLYPSTNQNSITYGLAIMYFDTYGLDIM